MAKSAEDAKKARKRVLTKLRQVANWGHITPAHKFEKNTFDEEIVNHDMVVNGASSKAEMLVANIATLDARDEAEFGHKFKHFIFSDVKEGGYGAKILASVLQASGFENLVVKRE